MTATSTTGPPAARDRHGAGVDHSPPRVVSYRHPIEQTCVGLAGWRITLGPDHRGQLQERLRDRLSESEGALTRETLVGALRGFVDAERERLRESFFAQPTGAAYGKAHSAVFDVLLGEMYQHALKAVTDRLGPIPAEADLCLAAVGGYGRASLAPWSDIDIVFIPSLEENEIVDAVVREMLLLLNETLVPGRHPQVAHSYRPLGDLGLIDHQTATALLESRMVAGNGSLHIHFMQELTRSLEPVEFMHLNFEERRVVWDDPRQSVFAVEPNLKSGPGGLRDFHAAIWVAKVVYGIQDWDILGMLRQRGTVSWEDSEAVLGCLEFILRARNWLHFARGQKLDVLHVDYHQELGVGLGYEPHDGETPGEQVMRDYYAAARRIHAFARRLMRAARLERLDFRHGTHVVDWTMYPNHDGIFREDPARLVLVYEEAQRLGLQHSLRLEQLIAANVECLDEAARNKLAVGSSFRRVLSSQNDVADTLRLMFRSGVLEQLLPEFAPLMVFLPGDPAHEYSVGEHTLKVLEEVQRLRDHPVGDDELTLADALRALQEPEVLFLAAMFHDVGKLDRSGDHSVTGAPVGEAVAQRLGLPEAAIDRVRFLILQHLTMMRTARLRALPLPETIEAFVRILPESDPLDALDMLTILTWSDARSVGDNIFRDNERRMLMELFVKAAKWIQEQPMVDEPGVRERIRRRLRDAPALRDTDPEVVRRHIESMPTWYTVNTPPALMAKHIAYLERVRRGEDPVVEFYHALQAMHTELTIVTSNRPGLLRDIAAAVTANNLDINLAQSDVCAACGEGDRAMSIATIWVDDFGHPLGQVKRDRLRADIESLLNGRESADEVLRRRGKQVPDKVVLHSVKVNNADSRQHSVVMVRADDQKGLLYRLTKALADEGLDIMVAKITTWRGAAEDAFYVASQQHERKLTDDEADRVAARLVARLTGEPAGVDAS